MKACVLEGIGQLIYKDVPDPVMKKGEVLLKIKAAGICGSDIGRVYVKGTYHFPTIPGHEFAGQIVDAFDEENKHLIGKKAAVFPLLPCRKCDMCEVGQYASCRDYDYFGSRCDGGFAEYISVPVWNLVMTEKDLSYEEMAMAEPAAVSLHALSRAGVELGDTVAIFGAGAIGLMLGGFAKAWGAGKVILFDIDNTKIDFAKKVGFEYAINSMEKDCVKAVMEITGGKGADISIEGAGVPSTYASSLKVAKPLGKVVLMGNPAGDMPISQHDYWEILRKQLAVFGTWNSSYTKQKNDWETVLAAMADGKLDAKKYITHRFPLSDVNKAFEMVRDKTEFSNRVMFIND